MPKQTKSYAPRISPSTWKRHQRTIKELFVDQNKTLSSVAEIMNTYGLHASESQYERQLKAWGIRKNRTRYEWRLITRTVKERNRQGKDSVVLVRGIKQPSERIGRELARSGYPRHTDFEYGLPGHIQVLTPPATPPKADTPFGHPKEQCPITEAVAFFPYTYRKFKKKSFSWQLVKYEKDLASIHGSVSSLDKHRSSMSEHDPRLRCWIHKMMEQVGREFWKQISTRGPDRKSIICYRPILETLSISSWESVGVTLRSG